jgi:hypothetical protein
LILWSTTVAVALPAAADAVNLTPPWPGGIVISSALLQLLTAVIAFQLMSEASRRDVSRFVALVGCVVLILGGAYLFALSQLIFIGGPAKERLVKGLWCTAQALSLPDFAPSCPLLTDGLIAKAPSVDMLWPDTSITVSRIMLAGLWYSTLISFSACVVVFTAFQSAQKGKIADGAVQLEGLDKSS